MKNVLFVAAVALISLSAYANEHKTTAKPAEAKTVATMSKSAAKKACATEGKKGKELKECIEAKLHPAQG